MAWRPSAWSSITSITRESARTPLSTSVCRACRLRISIRNSVRANSTSTGTSAPSEYTPATTWDGLEWVATPKWLRENRHPEVEIEPFTPAKVPEEDVLNEFLKAVVEVYEFKRCGSSLKLLDRISPHFKWPHGTTFQLREGEQEPTVSYINEEAKISLLESLGLMEKESSSIITEDRVAESNVKTPDQSWKRVPLTDMGLKFAIIKRIMRRTGRRVPDSKIASSKTAFALYSQLRLQEKPKKLAQVIEEEGRLHLPNVKVIPRKVTEVDTDISKGRWKVIRKALEDRNLPEFASEPWEDKDAQRKRHS